MKKSEAMDLYEGLNGISPKMIEEAGNYKKTASVDIRYKKSNNVKKIIAAGIVAAAAVTAPRATIPQYLLIFAIVSAPFGILHLSRNNVSGELLLL